MESKLRPIGTIFEIEYSPQETSTDPHRHKATYQVVGHVECLDLKMQPVVAEELKTLSYEELPN